MIDARTAPYGGLVLRLMLGIFFLVHGLIKVFVFTIPGFVKFFVAVGFSPTLAYLILLAELGGGAALILGLWTRWIALILFVEMLEVVHFHFANGFGFTQPHGGWEYPAMWAVALFVQVLLGDGAFAINSVLFGRSRARIPAA